jgi:Mrp family chromosome partitioning ATPase
MAVSPGGCVSDRPLTHSTVAAATGWIGDRSSTNPNFAWHSVRRASAAPAAGPCGDCHCACDRKFGQSFRSLSIAIPLPYVQARVIGMPLGTVISVLNMKGGVGKTTVSAHVMRVLYHVRAKKVLLIDLDPQFNLSQCLLTRATYDALKRSDRTVFTAMEPPPSVGLFDVATTDSPPPPRRRRSLMSSVLLEVGPHVLTCW